MSSLSKVPIQGPDKLLYLFQTHIIQWKEMLFFLSWTPTLLWSLPRLDFLSQWKSQKAPASTQGWDGSLAQLVGRVWEPWLWTALLLPEPGIVATFRAGGKKSKNSQATHLGLTMVLGVHISGFFLLWNFPFSEKPCLCAACNIFQVYLEKGKGGGEIKILKHLKCRVIWDGDTLHSCPLVKCSSHVLTMTHSTVITQFL